MSEEKDAKIQELEAEIARLKDENSKQIGRAHV